MSTRDALEGKLQAALQDGSVPPALAELLVALVARASADECAAAERRLAAYAARVCEDMERFRDRVCAATVRQTRDELDDMRRRWAREARAEAEEIRAEIAAANESLLGRLREAAAASAGAAAASPADTAGAGAAELLAEHLRTVDALRRAEMRQTREELHTLREELRELRRELNKAPRAAAAAAAAAAATPATSGAATPRRSAAHAEAFTPKVKPRGLPGLAFEACADGLVVTAVAPDSQAAGAGMRVGTIVSHADATLLTTVSDLNDYVDGLEQPTLKLTTFDTQTGRVRFLTLDV